ncbi:MAG: aldo/keto reductase [Nitrospinae bacterium]|nr:aldo/keto reductase [Nitrospinota bacterium]
MIYLDKKGFDVPLSRLGFGGMRFNDHNEGVNAVRYAFENGITYFDTAPGYCRDQSENIYGEAFKHIPRNKIIVSSKSGIWKDKTAHALLERVKTSIQRMGVDYLDVLHIWCIKDKPMFRRIITKGGPYEGAIKAKESGLVKHIFFSSHANNEVNKEILKHELFEGITIGFNILNSSARLETLQSAKKNKLITVSMNPLAGGMFTRFKNFFTFLKQESTASLIETALHYNLSHKELDIVLSGMSSVKEVEENIAAVNRFKEEHNPHLKAKSIEDALANLNGSFCTLCNYCIPCPVNIPIPTYMNVIDIKKVSGEQEEKQFYYWHKDRNSFQGIEADKCTECGVCEEKCTQHLPIIDRLKEVSDDFHRFGIK